MDSLETFIKPDFSSNNIGNIIVVEDEPTNSQVITGMLNLEGYNVITAVDGIDACDYIFSSKTVSFDLAIVDIMMPRMSGYELCKKIRETYNLFELPVLLLTAKDHMEDIVEGFNVGANDYLVKPFDRKELSARVKTLVSLNKMVQNSIEHSTRTLKLTQQKLIQSEKMVALGSMVAGVAHEINTPLGTGIMAISFIEDRTKVITEMLMQDKIKKCALEDYLQVTEEGSMLARQNLQRAVDLVSSFKRVSVDMCSEEMRSFKLKNLLEDVTRSLKPKFKGKKHKIRIQCDEEIEIKSFPGAISQIITNFLINTLIHAFDEVTEGEISIDAFIRNSRVVIIYKDNGKGIPEENKQKIFEPFFTTNKEGGGSGLGLHIVHSIVTQLLQGELKCESEWGKGTSFTIEFDPIEKVKTSQIRTTSELYENNIR